MNPWDDLSLRIPGDVAVRLARIAIGATERVVEVAVGSGLAVVSVWTGHLLLDQACPDLGDEMAPAAQVQDLAAA
jgi:hypothetical protein